MSETEITYSQSEQVNELVSALAKAKLKYGEVLKTKVNKYTGSVYADLQDLMNAAERPLAEEGLVVVHFPIEHLEQKRAGALTKLVHTSGQFFGNQFLMPATGKAQGGVEKLDAQTVTAGVTYAKRCNYGALAGLVGEVDDDGDALADKSTDVATAPKPAPIKPPAKVNQAKASTGGERPPEKSAVPQANLRGSSETANNADVIPGQKNRSGPVESPTAPISTSQTNDSKFDDVVPVQAAFHPTEAVSAPVEKPISSETPAESITSAQNTLESSKIPSKSQFDAYVKRIQEVRVVLEKHGLKPSGNQTTGAKLKQALLKSAEATDIMEIPIYRWEDFLLHLEPLAQSDAAAAVKFIEGGKS